VLFSTASGLCVTGPLNGDSSFSEAILEPSRHGLQIAHSVGAGGVAALRLL